MGSDRLVRGQRAVQQACDEATSVVELCRSVQRAVDGVVPSDRWCGFAVDPLTLFPTNGYHDEGVDARLFPRLLELEHTDDGANHLPTLARSPSGVATITDATGGDPMSSARWRDVLVPSGVPHELRAVCRSGTHVWGALILFRGSDVADFSADEAAFVQRVAPVVAEGFQRVIVDQHLRYGDDAREAGIILLGGDPLEVRTATEAARHWLDALDDGTLGPGMPTAVHSAAMAVRAGAAAPVAVRARTRSGRWVTITAEAMGAAPGAATDVGVIVQPSRPAEIAQIVTAAYGLTKREAEIVLLVAGGRTNQEIARTLSLSPFTVADHLKSVFAKLGVSTRGEATATLFHDHYLAGAAAGLPVGADGWFLPAR